MPRRYQDGPHGWWSVTESTPGGASACRRCLRYLIEKNQTLGSLKLDARRHTGWHVLSGQPDELERARLDFRRAGRSRASQGSSIPLRQPPCQARRPRSGPVSNGVLGPPRVSRALVLKDPPALRATRPADVPLGPKRCTVALHKSMWRLKRASSPWGAIKGGSAPLTPVLTWSGRD